MSRSTRREQEAKAELVASIARSQHALAHMLEQIAESTSFSDVTVKKLAENIRLLTQYQEVMSQMLTGISFNRVKEGAPAPVWLASIAGRETRPHGRR
ncbi:hypothetical protein ACH6EH_13720 [Paenibacillus sp. JSM ZJ436]|uniref:hypothetical protein n=1 Tax=Paenibacillus sp. JSM ZJ436 TaxID=3376190 RepID=UPI00379C875D